jgi:hypothetical protein
MRFLRKRLLLMPAFSLALWLFGTWLDAGEVAQQVELRIGSILASNQSNDFDPRLAKMKKQLEVFKYKSYKLIKEDHQQAGWNADTSFEIPGGRSLIVAPQGRQDNQLSLKVRLLEGEKPLLDTTVRLREGSNLLLGGPPHEGGVLILSISASAK